MTRLSEIFLRSAFRSGADRSLELSSGSAESGSAAQVFEVTDLLIPAGTDWSEGHEIGSFTVDAWIGGVMSSFLQVDGIPADTLRWIAASPITEISSIGVIGVSNLWGNSFADGQSLCFPRGFSVDETPAASYTISVGFTTADGADPGTPAPTTADITVVRARFAFLI